MVLEKLASQSSDINPRFFERAERAGSFFNKIRIAANDRKLPESVDDFVAQFVSPSTLTPAEQKLAANTYADFLKMRLDMRSRFESRESDERLFSDVFQAQPRDPVKATCTDLSLAFTVSPRDFAKIEENRQARGVAITDPDVFRDLSLVGHVALINNKPQTLGDRFMTWLLVKATALNEETPAKEHLWYSDDDLIAHENWHILYRLLHRNITRALQGIGAKDITPNALLTKENTDALAKSVKELGIDESKTPDQKIQDAAEILFDFFGKTTYFQWASETICQFTDGPSETHVRKIIANEYSSVLPVLKQLLAIYSKDGDLDTDKAFAVFSNRVEAARSSALDGLFALEKVGVGDRDYIASLLLFVPFDQWGSFSKKIVDERGSKIPNKEPN